MQAVGFCIFEERPSGAMVKDKINLRHGFFRPPHLLAWSNDPKTDRFQARLFWPPLQANSGPGLGRNAHAGSWMLHRQGFLLATWKRTCVPHWGVWGLLVGFQRSDSFSITFTTNHVRKRSSTAFLVPLEADDDRASCGCGCREGCGVCRRAPHLIRGTRRAQEKPRLVRGPVKAHQNLSSTLHPGDTPPQTDPRLQLYVRLAADVSR